MQGSGRERRRKGLVNRARRIAYGVMLICALPCTQAQAQDDNGTGQQHPRRFRIAPLMRMLGADPAEVSAISLGLSAENQGGNLRMGVNPAADSDGSGMGFAVGVPDMGYLYVNLYSPDEARGAGEWRITTTDGSPQRPLNAHEERVLLRGVDPNSTRTAISPQLMFDLDKITSTQTHLQASLQYAPWSSISNRPGGGERVAQMALRWPF